MSNQNHPINKSVFSDLKLFRAVVNAIAQTSDNEQTKIEAQHLDVYLVERITQLEKASKESPTTKQRKIYRNGHWETI